MTSRLTDCCRRWQRFSDEAKLDSAALAELASAAAKPDLSTLVRLLADHWQLYETYSREEQRRLDAAVVAAASSAAVVRSQAQ